MTKNRVARVTSTGAIDPTFTGAGPNNTVDTIIQQADGKYIVGGTFTTYNGVTANRVVRLTSTGAIDPTFAGGTGANNQVAVIVSQPDGKYLL